MVNYRRDPWGNDSKQPPDLDKIISDVVRKFQKLFGSRSNNNSGNNSGSNYSGSGDNNMRRIKPTAIVIIIAIIIFIIWVASGIFIVSPAEEAVQLRLGKYQTTLGPGPHWIPRLIDSYYKVNVQRVNSFSFDVDLLTKSSNFETNGSTQDKVKAKTNSATEANDDTDKNVVYIELSIQYRVIDPKLYLFNIIQGGQTLKEVAKSQLSSVVGQMGLNTVLTKGRDQIAIDVSRNVQELMDKYQAGISVVAVNVRKAQAPEQVADAFLDVVQAGQDEQRYIQQAQAYASKVVPIAQGASSRIVADANAYKEKVVLTAQADVASYLAILDVYKKAPKITAERLYLETMQKVLALNNKVLIDSDGNNNNLLYLPIDQLKNYANYSSSASQTLTDNNFDTTSSTAANNTGHASQQNKTPAELESTEPSVSSSKAGNVYSQWYQSNNRYNS